MADARFEKLDALSKERIVYFDGAMGTQVQSYDLQEEDFRGDQFVDHAKLLKGNNDLLNLTRPDIIAKIHEDFLDVGADILSSNSFCATTIAQADYDLSSVATDIAKSGAQIAHDVVRNYEKKHGEMKWVAGSLGPTNKTLSISPRVEDPGYRDISFDEMKQSYVDQAEAMAPYVDLLVIETIFDTLNAKAAILACKEVADHLPLIISGTMPDQSGRTLSGQTPEAFVISILHANPWAVGLNCALGAKIMRPLLVDLANATTCKVIAYPNAGMPNEFGEYDETPEEMSAELGEWAKSGLVNILGGCCGSTPEHIRAIREKAKKYAPRGANDSHQVIGLNLSGLEPFKMAG